jgi:hypothetical protein
LNEARRKKSADLFPADDPVILVLDHFAAFNGQGKAVNKQTAEPEVGIFFVYDGRPLIDGVRIREAENSPERFKSQKRTHENFWYNLQRLGLVPRQVVFSDVPRGRVVLDVKQAQFIIYADACIRRDKLMLEWIGREMSIPCGRATPVKGDPNYRCAGCR